MGLEADLLEKTVGALTARGEFLRETLGLTDNADRVIQELAVADLQPILALRNSAAARAGDLPDLITHGARAIAKTRTCA